MQDLLQPPPEVIAFFTLKKFVYLEVLAVLALGRVLVARGPCRWLAGASLLLALAGIAAQFGPAALGLYDGAFYRLSALAVNAGGGMALLLAASLPLALSGFARGVRGHLVDIAHALLVGALLGLRALGG